MLCNVPVARPIFKKRATQLLFLLGFTDRQHSMKICRKHEQKNFTNLGLLSYKQVDLIRTVLGKLKQSEQMESLTDNHNQRKNIENYNDILLSWS